MLFGLFFGDWTILLVLPGMIFAIVAQIKVQSSFKKYSKVQAPAGMTGGALARRMLDCNGMNDVNIEIVKGQLSDHYDPRANVIRLSDSVYGSVSAAAIGVAAHEAGHAVQHATGYFPIRVRAAAIPATRFGSMLAIPLFFIGLLLASPALLLLGIGLYSFVAFFQLVTLPVEFNASTRAISVLRSSGMLTKEELAASKKVLTAAALTYVAALLTSLLTLLRLLVLAGGVNRRR